MMQQFNDNPILKLSHNSRTGSIQSLRATSTFKYNAKVAREGVKQALVSKVFIDS